MEPGTHWVLIMCAEPNKTNISRTALTESRDLFTLLKTRKHRYNPRNWDLALYKIPRTGYSYEKDEKLKQTFSERHIVALV